MLQWRLWNRTTCGKDANIQEDLISKRYKIDKLVEHETQQDGSEIHRIRWYAYESNDDTWDPMKHVTRTKIMKYWIQKNIPLPNQVQLAEID